MILQGKVLKDDNPLSDYGTQHSPTGINRSFKLTLILFAAGPEGKTIHLVKNAPPSVQLECKGCFLYFIIIIIINGFNS